MISRLAVGRLLLAYGLSAVAIGLPWPLLLVLVYERYGDSPHAALLLGLTGAARMLPYVLLSWAVGSIGDRVPRDRLIRATLLVRVVLLVGAAVALAQDAVLVAVVAASLAVAVATPSYPALAAALPGLAGDDRRRATDALVTIEVSSWVVGPALGGLLLLPATRDTVLLVAVALVVASLVLMVGIPVPGPGARAAEEPRRAVSAMLTAVTGSRAVVAAMAVAGLLNLLESTTAMVLLPLTHRVWDQGDAGFGVATAWLGFGALAAPLLWWMRGSPTARRVRGMLALGAAVLVVAVAPATVALPLLAVTGAFGVLVESAATETIQDGVSDEHRAGALGLADSVMVGSALVGSLVAPALAAWTDPRVLLVAVAVACGSGAALAARAHRSDRSDESDGRVLPGRHVRVSPPARTGIEVFAPE